MKGAEKNILEEIVLGIICTDYHAIKQNISTDVLIEKLDSSVPIYSCDYCGRLFSSKQSKYQHKTRCKAKTTDETALKIKELEDRMATSIGGSTNIINNTNNIHDNIIINIKNFGCENMKHIEQDKTFLTSCLILRDIKSLIENIHCDKEYPENHNVRIKSIKKDLMETYVDGRWIISDKEETLDELMNKGYRVLKFHSHKNKTDIKDECDDDEEYKNIQQWLESIYEDNKIRKPIKKQLLILFMNNKALLLGKDI